MKLPALLDAALDRIYAPWMRRQAMATISRMATTQAARVVATLAPADAAADYVHTVMLGERRLTRWKYAYTSGGALMPLAFAMWGHLLGGGWWIVHAQIAWILVWSWFGIPWVYVMVENELMELTAQALADMAATVDATQEQLNAASARLGLGTWSEP